MTSDSERLPGRLGVYRILSRRPFALGRSSALYEAIGPDGQVVCAKLFRATTQGDDSPDPSEFLSELEAQTHLSHPNILPILDFGLAPDGADPFVIYPLCRGGNLRALITAKPFLPVSEAIPILAQVAAAIDAAHEEGFIHGDIKPENILFAEKGAHPLLGDFGISRHFPFVERFGTAPWLSGRNAGTITYLSPEQLADGEQSTRSDIYSFGIVAYEVLAGALPFDPNAPLYRQIEAKVDGTLIDPAEASPDLPKVVTDALRAALSVKRADRPTSAGAFCRMLKGEAIQRSQHCAQDGGLPGAAPVGRKGTWASLDTKAKVTIIAAAIVAGAGILAALINLLPVLFK